MTLTDEQQSELKRLKQYFPFRVVFGVLDKDTKTFQAYAKTTKRTAYALSRKGHNVFILE